MTPQSQSSNEAAEFSSHSDRAWEIKAIEFTWDEKVEIGKAQRMVAAAAVAIFTLDKLADRTDEGIAICRNVHEVLQSLTSPIANRDSTRVGGIVIEREFENGWKGWRKAGFE